MRRISPGEGVRGRALQGEGSDERRLGGRREEGCFGEPVVKGLSSALKS